MHCGRLSIGIIGLEINETIFDLFIYINSLKSNEVLESSSVIAYMSDIKKMNKLGSFIKLALENMI